MWGEEKKRGRRHHPHYIKVLREEKRLEDTDGTEARKKKNGNRRLDKEATLLASGRALQTH